MTQIGDFNNMTPLVVVKLSRPFHDALKDLATLEESTIAGKARQIIEEFLLSRFQDRLNEKDRLGTKIGRPKGTKAWQYRRCDGNLKVIKVGCYIRICSIDTIARLAELQHLSRSEMAEKMVAKFKRKGQFDFQAIRQRKRDGEIRHNTAYVIVPQYANFIRKTADESGCSISGIIDYILEWATPYMLKKIEKLEKEDSDDQA